MAVLQKIRSKGALLLVIVGVALFAFIAEEFVRSIQTTTNERRQVAGEVCGERISSIEFQRMLEDYKEAMKFMRGDVNLSEMESAQTEDNVWQLYVNNQLIKEEAEKLGLTVTDKELQDVLTDGTHPMLAQTPFINQQTRRFDVSMLKNFLEEYKKMQSNAAETPQQYIEQYNSIYKYWNFMEKTLRDNLLQQKYQMLLAASITTNPVETKRFFDDNSTSSNILLAAFNVNSIKDSEVEVTDAEIKEKYEATKQRYMQFVENREINFVAKVVEASEADKKALNETMDGINEKLQNAEDLAAVVRSSNSLVPYNNIPVTKNALPNDIQNQLDSISVGTQKGPYFEATDNSMNIIKLIAKVQVPDSIKYRMISIGGETPEAARKIADSLYVAIKGGEVFDSVAHKYNQEGAEQWLTSADYENSMIDENNSKMIKALSNAPVGELQNISLDQGNIIILVTERAAITTKYNVAVIKRPITFSKETYSKAYNEFSKYLATNTTIEQLEKNAPKNGYEFQYRPETFSNQHFIDNILSTKNALRWVYDEDTKEGDISPLYECGENNTLLVVALKKIHKKGYLALEDVKDIVRNEVLREKKLNKLVEKLKGIKSIEDCQSKGAVIDSLNNLNFNSNAFVAAIGAQEPVINASICGKKAAEFVGPVKGNRGVYAYQVLSVEKDTKADFKKQEAEIGQMVRSMYMRSLNSFGTDLYLKGNVIDKRYLFF